MRPYIPTDLTFSAKNSATLPTDPSGTFQWKSFLGRRLSAPNGEKINEKSLDKLFRWEY
jgi:hypothetical protein